jgi:uncharacterized protein (TIGR02453 family)
MKNKLLFPKTTLNYLGSLARNNNKDWFEKNREKFKAEFLEPAMQFVVDMGEKLAKINPDIQFMPRIDKSIFRLHRDIRFSKNKAPYKTNLGILWWEGTGKKMECSGFYFHLEPGNHFLAAGMYVFSKDQLKVYRDIVSDADSARELNHILSRILKNKGFKLGGKSFKRIPKGYELNQKFPDLLLHSGLFIYYEDEHISDLNYKNTLDLSFKIYKQLSPLHNWLVENIA